MNRMFVVLASLLALGAVTGCATGSALVTGQTRAVIEDFTTVSILTEMPEGAEEIAILQESSDSGWTQQESLDYAVEELKQQAAKVGANAVVLTGRDTSTQVLGVPVAGGGTIVTSSNIQLVHGVAVWIEP